MPIAAKAIMPCLWFDTEAEAAANHYVSIFPKSKLGKITRYGKEGKEIHGKAAGSVLTVEFEIEGHEVSRAQRRPAIQVRRGGLVPGPLRDRRRTSTTSGASSPQGGSEGQCGWLKDKFGLSWQVVPTVLPEMLQDKNAAKGGPRHESDAADAQVRHRGLASRPAA